jgi:hypothetical protein
MHGVGAKAHEWLVTGAPYESVDALISYERNRRIKEAVKAKNKAGEEKLKLGHSPLNKSVISTLIVSGAMDSFFPADMDVYTKIQTFEEAYARINEKKKPRPIPDEMLNLTPMARYQMRKKILPAYSEPILPMLRTKQDEYNGIITMVEGTPHYNTGEESYKVVTPDEYENIASMTMLPKAITVAVPAYVLTERLFRFDKNTKEGCEIILDHSGLQIKAVKWGDKKTGKMAKSWPKDLAGSIAIVLLSRWSDIKPFAIESISIIQPALSNEEPEESA